MSFDPRWPRVQELIEQAERLPAPARDGWLRDHEPDPAARAEALEVLAAMEQEVNASRQRLSCRRAGAAGEDRPSSHRRAYRRWGESRRSP